MKGRAERRAKLSVTLDIPLAAHGFAAGFAAFGIKQNPFPPARRSGAHARIMLLEASLQLRCPADIGSVIILAAASEHISEKTFRACRRPFRHGDDAV